MRSPLLAAVGAGVGSIVLMGGVTAVVSLSALNVVQHVTARQKRSNAKACTECRGSGYVSCEICMRRGIVKCRAPRTMKQLLMEARGQAASDTPQPAVECICPACGTTLQQRCLNCLGEGKALLPNS